MHAVTYVMWLSHDNLDQWEYMYREWSRLTVYPLAYPSLLMPEALKTKFSVVTDSYFTSVYNNLARGYLCMYSVRIWALLQLSIVWIAPAAPVVWLSTAHPPNRPTNVVCTLCIGPRLGRIVGCEIVYARAIVTYCTYTVWLQCTFNCWSMFGAQGIFHVVSELSLVCYTVRVQVVRMLNSHCVHS